MLPFGQSGNWDLIFQDEFDAESLDTDIWTLRYWDGTVVNWYGLGLVAPDDAYLQDGKLRLRAQKRDMISEKDGTLYYYTAGLVTTGGMRDMLGGPPPSFDFTYGYAEIRARVPAGRGFKVAFWAVPSSLATPPYDWVGAGEIDVLEILGTEPTRHHMAYHWENNTPNTINAGEIWYGPDFSEDFHIFAIDWRPDVIIWYVDGIERWRHEENIQSDPMFLILSLFVGGVYIEDPDESTIFPSYYDIDYIRVWEKGGAMTIIADLQVIETVLRQHVLDLTVQADAIAQVIVDLRTLDDTLDVAAGVIEGD